ncbi:MAG: LysM peptidoglycan-binding domain-containing protein [Bacillota bacterium]|nr:LysM peptidoglycan-binding domain-containing protein [Bacillota bacterium]
MHFKKLRIKNCLLFLLSLILIVFLLNSLVQEAHAEEEIEMLKVVVREGNTLWELVDKYCDYDCDLRSAIHEVKRYNELTNNMIFPGQIIYIPLNIR